MKFKFFNAFLASLILLASNLANAGIIYDNGPSGNADGWNFGNPSSADDFLLTSDAIINGVTFWAYSNDVSNLANIGWGIAEDSGNTPGSYIATGLAASTSVVDTGFNISSLDIFQVDFSFSGVSLSANTSYWLALDSGVLGTNNTSGFSGWLWTNESVKGSSSVYGGPTNWNVPNGADNAFQLHASVDVPEPSTLAIFALGMIGLASCRFKKQF
ncbi:PEP-CTERM sorting domain-containing protein [Alteromonas sp. MB-3u-76]|uniref:PEP-CTERM sorting domain-containing protein n=1 Tax=Alteromonas sp. MB-3u-76 TaxID=2058133 RepID=UPI001E4DCA04|nr:PEP-CTERM sorting domain-containing protein [Alteromonas sp. MB-3u-76]